MSMTEPLRVATTRFGAIEVPAAEAVLFDDGLLGFPDAQRFALISVDDNTDLFWLQSIDDGTLAFLTTSPWVNFPEYVHGSRDIGRVRLATWCLASVG